MTLTCVTAKRAYRTQAEAEEHLADLLERSPHRKEKRTYWCDRCGYFHLTSKSLAAVRKY